MKNRITSILFCIFLVLFMLTFCIGLPIYCRFLYYIQIKTLNLESATGWSYDTIKTAYDEVLNYLTLPGMPFGTGKLKYSESGAAHFADCKVLFDLNLGLMLSSAAVLVVIIILNALKITEPVTFAGRKPYFWSAIIAVSIPVVLGIIVAIDFDSAFTVFHSIFFPGKDNWIFNPHTDEIIKVMPQRFFMNCAIVIGAGLVAFSSALIAADLIISFKKDVKKTLT